MSFSTTAEPELWRKLVITKEFARWSKCLTSSEQSSVVCVLQLLHLLSGIQCLPLLSTYIKPAMEQLLGLIYGMHALQLLSRDSMYLTLLSPHFISRHAPTSECALWIARTITIDTGLYM